ncbi:MAG: PRC-barrel domain-containing protein [Casimicrobium sp.]|jgi:sporulation protein YlmC with PRC-barrel domain
MTYVTRDRLGIYNGHATASVVSGTDRGPGPDLMGAETLIGDLVFNHKDEELGEIKEIMLDMRNGKVGYAVMSFGGVLGIGEKLFAVPWNALELDTKRHRFVLRIEKDSLKDAPGFDKGRWPDMADHTWTASIHNYYGTTPYWGDVPL